MHLRFNALLFVLMLITAGSMHAQTAPTESSPEKEKAAQEMQKNALELLDQTINEAAALKLPENRAFIYATAGDVLWKQNEKRARQLFRDAANEIVQASSAPVEKSDSPMMMVTPFGRMEIYNLRRMLLQTLATHDAEFALELLQTTRPADVAAEMQNYLAAMAAAPQNSAAPQNPATPPAPKPPRNFKAQQEIQLEQSIAARAAEQDPQKAAQLIRESWSKGLSYEVMNLIYKVGVKDIDLANKLLGETVQKALDADFAKKQSDMSFAINLLGTFTNPRRASSNNKVLSQLKVDDKTLKDLANKVADALLKTSGFEGYFSFNSALPVLEKIVPERAALLKQKQGELRKQMPQGAGIGTGFAEMPHSMNDPNATAETIIAEAAKADPRMRGMLYRQAAYRASELSTGETEKIRALLQSQPQSKERDDAISMIDSNLVAKQLRDGKIDEARKIIDQMTPGNNKVEQMVALAVTSYRLNTKESREAALKLMDDARQMVKDFPEDKDETDGLVKVIAGYAAIDPARAFTMLSPIVEQANELINASAILAKYNKQNQIFRDGEILMVNGFRPAGTNFFRYGKELKMLAQADLPRTRGLIDQFRREDVRLFVKLFIAQAILKEQIGLSGAMFVSSG